MVIDILGIFLLRLYILLASLYSVGVRSKVEAKMGHLLILILASFCNIATPFLHAPSWPRARTSLGANRALTPQRPMLLAGATTIAPKKPEKLGVLFLNLGGPEKLDDVEGFLYNLFADPDIIRLPFGVRALQKPIATYISKTRSVQAKAAYDSIGGGSPIVR